MTLNAGESFLAGASDSTIENLVLSSANFEYSYTFPMRTRKFSLRPRSDIATAKYSFESGESGSKYMTIPVGGKWEDMVGLEHKTIYVQSTTAGLVVEIESWG